MTIIVFKDGVFAADSLVTEGGMVSGHIDKITDMGELVYGFSGVVFAKEEFEKFISGKQYDDSLFKREDANFSALVVNRSTKDIRFFGDGLTMERYRSDFYVIGSGRLVASGAMLMGATPEQAVRIAMKVDTCSGGEVQVVKVW